MITKMTTPKNRNKTTNKRKVEDNKITAKRRKTEGKTNKATETKRET